MSVQYYIYFDFGYPSIDGFFLVPFSGIEIEQEEEFNYIDIPIEWDIENVITSIENDGSINWETRILGTPFDFTVTLEYSN